MSPRALHRARAVAALAAVLGLFGARSAGAQPASGVGDKALAESLFQEAKRLMKSGNVQDACPKLAESNRIVPKLGTLLNLATCHGQEGKTASAWAEFTQAESLATSAKQAERARYAHEQAQDLQKRLSHVLIEAPGADKDLVVTLDGKVVDTVAVLGTPLSLDPGNHEIAVSAPGKKPWTTTTKVEPGPATVRVTVPPLEKDTAPPAAPVAPGAPIAPPPVPTAPTGPSERGGSAQRLAGIVVMAAGAAAGLGLGIGFGAKTFSAEGDSNSHCTGTLCDPTGVDDRHTARVSSTISTTAFIAGGAVFVAGLVVTLTASSSPKPQPRGEGAAARSPRAALWLAPAMGPGRSDLVVGGAW